MENCGNSVECFYNYLKINNLYFHTFTHISTLKPKYLNMNKLVYTRKYIGITRAYGLKIGFKAVFRLVQAFWGLGEINRPSPVTGAHAVVSVETRY